MIQIKIFINWLCIGGVYLLSSCSSSGEARLTTEPIVQSDTSSILGDRFFEHGLLLKRADKPAPGAIFPYGVGSGVPIWEMAEWGTKYELSDLDKVVEEDGRVVFANPGKSISFRRSGEDMGVTMDVYTSAEYDAPRIFNESWPHLLIETGFIDKPYMKDLQGLMLRFEGKLTKEEMKMKESDFNPGLHAAQFQLFITVQDANPNSANYGDFLWFGIPFYDYRYESIPLYAAQDVGKGDATGKFIYSIGSADFMEGSFNSGNWITIEKDLYPEIVKGLELAKQRGYLTGSAFDDFRVSGMNLGWEVPGTFDVGFEFKGFDILKVVKKK